jgi:TolB-like protein
MFTDIVGYTAMVQANESRALDLLRKHRDLLRPILTHHEGREVKTMGDAFLVEFPSALAATECAVELQKALQKFNEGKRDKVRVRVGIHVGDVVHERGDVYGDAVNIASRIETVMEGGGVCVSQQVYDQVRNKVPFLFSRLGAQELKNVSFPIDVYKLELLEKETEKGATVDARRRLAVLPFTNMSPDPNDEYFADGLTEEMISTLSKLPEIEVISRTSIMQYKKSSKPIKEVYRELNSGTILEGSVRKADGRVRITVQMIDARKDKHLWAETYDRDLRDIFEIQSEIARLVAAELKVKMLPSPTDRTTQRPTSNARAYTLYLHGRYHWNMRGLEDIKRAADYFKRAVREDPDFALGYVGLGDCHQVLATRFELDVDENWRKARTAVDRALRLDPRLAEAHASKAVALFAGYDLLRAEEEFRRAIDLKPSYASAHQWYSQLLIAQLRWDEALSQIEKAAELDPFSLIVHVIHTFLYEARRDYGSGLRISERAVELNPNDGSCHIELAWFYGKMRRFGEMEKEMNVGFGLIGKAVPRADLGREAMVAYLRGDKEKIRRMLPELKAHIGETFTAIRFIADLYFYLGEVDEGFEWLGKCFSKREFDLFYIKSDEFLDGVRSDGRYIGLLEKLGLN